MKKKYENLTIGDALWRIFKWYLWIFVGIPVILGILWGVFIPFP